MNLNKRKMLSALLGLSALPMHAFAYDCTGLSAWNTSEVYVKGDLVTQQNSAFEAQWWTRGESPVNNSAPYSVWKSLGQCGGNQTPNITLTSPTDGTVLPVNDSAVFSAQASDNDGQVVQVEFFVNDQSIGIDRDEPYQVNWQSVLGEYQISATATDDQGATKKSNIATLLVRDGMPNLPPTIELLSPAHNSQYKTGEAIKISADAQDKDGQIKDVSFWLNNTLLATDSNAPYEYNWVASVGEQQIKVVATDDLAATASAQVTVAVTDPDSGGCANIPAYQAGGPYAAGDVVSHNNHKYRCDVGPWCSSTALWAYEPGVGQHWQEAWTDQGICAIKPDVSFVTPAPNSTLLQGNQYEINVTANDADGQVAQVDVYANNTLLANLTQAPYSVNWQAQPLGTVSLKAIATDNEGHQGISEQVVNVTDKPLVASITAPTAGTQITLGNSVQLKASAAALVGEVTQVSFSVDGVVIATDTTAPYAAPYTPASLGAKTIVAIAKDNQGNEASSAGVSVKVIDKPLGKTHKLIGYWHNFVNPAGCPIPLNQMSDAWDIIDIAFADNDRNSNGTVHFNLFEKDIHSNCPPIDPVQFKQDMRNLQAQGKVFVLSLGGAEGTITLNTDSDEANFVASLTDIINEWGFDGLDIDLESGSNLVHGSQIQARLPRALKQIEQNIGGDMVLTMAPEHPYVHGGMIAYTGIWGAYIPLINELRDTLDLLHVQLYNNGGLPNPYEPGSAPEGSINMMVAHAKMLIEGFELADGTQFMPLRDDQVAIGLPSGPQSANSGQAPIGNITAALDCLIKGVSCSSIVPSKLYPNFGGVMTWSINWDKYDGYNFSKPIGDKLDQLNQAH
ncbi:Ig-like domain-containing protein [Pseudoalteromonas sp. MMG022]|uniref:Ig-like domain-containing protein n=1 Tax=Pseudoalteromonas sp. MMG022 TaxID=2909978 RepID=UPI001F20A3BD|nr:Ig-like domain-containing protein [Pseudoalteromonas sp. MMG022]MCF6434911.1 Ig-like domain-containing protein [Pseudoalteromonas sp. MMG022]